MLASYNHVAVCEAATAAAAQNSILRIEQLEIVSRIQAAAVVCVGHAWRGRAIAIGFERWVGMTKGLSASESRRYEARIQRGMSRTALARWSCGSFISSQLGRLHQVGQVLAGVLLMLACTGYLHRRSKCVSCLERWRVSQRCSGLEEDMEALRWEHAQKEFDLQKELGRWEKQETERLMKPRETRRGDDSKEQNDQNRSKVHQSDYDRMLFNVFTGISPRKDTITDNDAAVEVHYHYHPSQSPS